MLHYAKNKIKGAQIQLKPFPYIFLKNFLKSSDLKKINKILPDYSEIEGDGILYQSKSKTKKTLLPNSSVYVKLSKKKSFKDINFLFSKLKPIIVKKFKNQIKTHVKKKFHNTKLNYHSSFSIMKKGYVKSAHLDRRDHLFHMIFYPYSEPSKGGELCINSLNRRDKVYDTFPDKKNVKIYKKYKVENNSCIIILNVPWAYHSVKKYNGKKDRKYFYMAYDFPIKKSGSKIKNRKQGFNKNQFWNYQVKVKSTSRKNNFLSE